MSFPNRGEGGGAPPLRKIPTFSRFFWQTSLSLHRVRYIHECSRFHSYRDHRLMHKSCCEPLAISLQQKPMFYIIYALVHICHRTPPYTVLEKVTKRKAQLQILCSIFFKFFILFILNFIIHISHNWVSDYIVSYSLLL